MQDLAICGDQLNAFRMRKSDELAVVGCAVRPCHQLQNSIGRNGKLAAFKTCLRFANDFLRGIDCECLLSDR